MPGGERYNPQQTDEERRSYDNLVLFCYPHHIETNDVEQYPVSKLREIKLEHEHKFEKTDFKIDESALFKLFVEMEEFWSRIERLNTLEHSMAELAVDINAKGSFSEIMRECRENVSYLQTLFDNLHSSDRELKADFASLLQKKGIQPSLFDDISYYENPFESRNWELHNLGVTNRMQQLYIDLMHIEIKYLEEYLKTNSKDREARKRLEHLKESFAKVAQHAAVVD